MADRMDRARVCVQVLGPNGQVARVGYVGIAATRASRQARDVAGQRLQASGAGRWRKGRAPLPQGQGWEGSAALTREGGGSPK
jgi:hypothetical protein